MGGEGHIWSPAWLTGAVQTHQSPDLVLIIPGPQCSLECPSEGPLMPASPPS